MGETLTEVEYLRRDNRRLRQQCSAEGKEKYVERLKDAVARAEQREREACVEADTLRLNAERYEKLKAEIRKRGIMLIQGMESESFDAYIDTLEVD